MSPVACGTLPSGELLELLPQARPASMPLSIVYRGARMVPQRVRAFIEAMEQVSPAGGAARASPEPAG